MIEAGTHERWDARPGSRLRAVLGFVPLILFAFGSAAAMCLLGSIAPGTRSNSHNSRSHADA